MSLCGLDAGGFNQPIMCGGEPRVMTKKERGSQCVPFFSIKINVPKHGKSFRLVFDTVICNDIHQKVADSKFDTGEVKDLVFSLGVKDSFRYLFSSPICNKDHVWTNSVVYWLDFGSNSFWRAKRC